ncbi:MAG TPA: phage tail protein, partial [Geobacteraceae bacterium]
PGQQGGTETVALTTAQIPAHTHTVSGENSLGNAATPIGGSTCLWSLPADTTKKAIAVNPFSNPAAAVQMDQAIIANAGGGMGHDNMQPYLTVNFCICLQGYYPPRP